MLPSIIKVRTNENYLLEMEFNTGEVKQLDFSSYLDLKCYASLKDINLFQKARVAWGTVVWSPEIDIDPEFLYKEGKLTNKKIDTEKNNSYIVNNIKEFNIKEFLEKMPTISTFYGIIIRLYYPPKEHEPPHLHAEYQDYRATFDIKTTKLLSGEFPKKQTLFVRAWMEIHKDEIYAAWQMCQNQEVPMKIEPLR